MRGMWDVKLLRVPEKSVLIWLNYGSKRKRRLAVVAMLCFFVCCGSFFWIICDKWNVWVSLCCLLISTHVWVEIHIFHSLTFFFLEEKKKKIILRSQCLYVSQVLLTSCQAVGVRHVMLLSDTLGAGEKNVLQLPLAWMNISVLQNCTDF